MREISYPNYNSMREKERERQREKQRETERGTDRERGGLCELN